jgi:hypothetical protein
MNPTFNISSRDASHLLRGLVEVNKAQHARYVKKGGDPFTIIKAIQQKRLRYRKADPREKWLSYNELLQLLKKKGKGADCEDLSAAVVAELQSAGIPARTYVYKARPGLFHVIVKTDKWGFLDPSVSAGMTKV